MENDKTELGKFYCEPATDQGIPSKKMKVLPKPAVPMIDLPKDGPTDANETSRAEHIIVPSGKMESLFIKPINRSQTTSLTTPKSSCDKIDIVAMQEYLIIPSRTEDSMESFDIPSGKIDSYPMKYVVRPAADPVQTTEDNDVIVCNEDPLSEKQTGAQSKNTDIVSNHTVIPPQPCSLENKNGEPVYVKCKKYVIHCTGCCTEKTK